MGKIIPANDKHPAIIKLSPEDRIETKQAAEKFFSHPPVLKKGDRLIIADSETLTPEGRARVKDGIMTIE